MRTSESITNIAPAMIALRKELGPIQKRGYNTHFRYNYATLESYVEAIETILPNHGLAIINSANPDIKRSDNNIVEVVVTSRLIHSSGEWIEISCPGEGQDKADKGTYKAITGARKYALACMFNLATTDDPEKEEPMTKNTKQIVDMDNIMGRLMQCSTIDELREAYTWAISHNLTLEQRKDIDEQKDQLKEELL